MESGGNVRKNNFEESKSTLEMNDKICCYEDQSSSCMDEVDTRSVRQETETASSRNETASVKKKQIRSYDKVLACFYCQKLKKLKMKRHLETVHRKEHEVCRLNSITDNKERKLGFARLISRGNFNHNVGVLESGDGMLIVGRRTRRSVDSSPDDYLPCVHCLVFYLARDLYRHNRNCKFQPKSVSDHANDQSEKAKKSIVSSSWLLLEGAVNGENVAVSPRFRGNVLQNMRRDDLTRIVKRDAIILRFGTSMYDRHGKNRAHDISQRMRQLARLLREVNRMRPKEMLESLDLDGCLSGNSFDLVIDATRSLCGYHDDQSGRPLFHNPSLGLKLGHSLAKCADLKKGLALRSANAVKIQDAEAFLAIHKADWTDNVSSASLATLKHRRYNNPQILPVTSDLVTLKNYQELVIPELTKQFERHPTYSTWRTLMENVYTRLVIFNKRRCGETAKLMLAAFAQRPKWEQVANDEIVQTLQPLERKLLQRYLKATFIIFQLNIAAEYLRNESFS